MKTAFRKTFRGSPPLFRWAARQWPVAVLAAVSFSGSGLMAQVPPGAGPMAAPAMPALPPPPMLPAPPPGGDDARPLPPQVAMMPRPQQEMEVIQRRSQLMVMRGNVIRTAIADPSVIDLVQFTGNELAIIGTSIGSTTLTLWFDNDPNPLIYEVRCVRDPSLDEQRRLDYGKLERKLAIVFPNSKVYLIPMSGKIIVKGQARDSEEAANILQLVQGEAINQLGSLAGPQPDAAAAAVAGGAAAGGLGISPLNLNSSYVINMLEVPGEHQIMVRVRIAEVNRTRLRNMGISLAGLFDQGESAVASGMGGFPSTLTGIFENGEISYALNWLASNGTIKMLAEPTLTVLSGAPASFLAGQEFPVPTIVGINGVGGQQTSFRGAGTALIVIPTVVDKDLIRLQITPEFSQINAGIGNGGVAGADVRRVMTTVQLREGQTIAIAGLIHNQQATQVSRIPYLGSIPLIGPILFANKSASLDESELLILVTPELVRPMDADEVPPSPGFYVTPPSDKELYWKGLTEGYPDLTPYQLPPFGAGANFGIPVPYSQYNPAPTEPLYSPVPTNPYGSSLPPQPLPYPPQGAGPASSPAQVPSYGPTPMPYPPYQSAPLPTPVPTGPEVPVPQRTTQRPAHLPPPPPAPPVDTTIPQRSVSPAGGTGWTPPPTTAPRSRRSLWSGPIQQTSATAAPPAAALPRSSRMATFESRPQTPPPGRLPPRPSR